MRRVVVTGMGIWSCIGQDLQTVTESLRQGRSGIIFDPKRIEYGLQSGLVGNVPRPDLKPLLPRKFRATMSEDTEYAYMAARQAFEQAGISDEYLRQNEVGVIWGHDGNSEQVEMAQIMEKEKNSLMIGPYQMVKSGASTVVVNFNSIFHLKGTSFSIAAACASSSHSIGVSTMLIKQGIQDIMLVGGSMEVENLVYTTQLDALGILSLTRSCPFDKKRDGFVISGGGAALVLEEYEHAKARGVNILAEVLGYGFSSNDIGNISNADNKAEYQAMCQAVEKAKIMPCNIDYVNAHGTSTHQGDLEEAKALTRLFGSKSFISSTKSMTGHECWMAGASEAIYSILMMQNNFVAPNINLEDVIVEAKDLNIARETIYAPINTVLSNSSGMGGTNSALIFRKL